MIYNNSERRCTMYYFHPILLPSSSMLIPNCSDAVSAICNDACNFCSNYLSNFLGTSTCGTVSERSRIHRLLQRGQKRQRIALLHRFVAAIHMGRPENTERSVHCVQRRPSVLGLHRFLIITPIYFIINCASSTTHFTYRTKYI